MQPQRQCKPRSAEQGGLNPRATSYRTVAPLGEGNEIILKLRRTDIEGDRRENFGIAAGIGGAGLRRLSGGASCMRIIAYSTVQQ